MWNLFKLFKKKDHDIYENIVNNLTIAIIGPCNPRSLNNIPNYKPLCKNILVCTWSDMHTVLVDKFEKSIQNDEQITLYKERSPFMRERVVHSLFHHYRTLLPQVKGIWLAAKECKTKYMIRTRSDASFSDLSKMIIRFSKHLDTVVSSNIIWRPHWNNRPFHMGDHCFISDTETIEKVYWDFYRFKDYNGRYMPNQSCEEYLYYFFRKHNRIPVPINVYNLGDFEISVSSKIYNNENLKLLYNKMQKDMLIDYHDNDDIIAWKQKASEFKFNP